MPKICDLLQAIDAKFPLARADSWDKVGLQVGDANATVKSVLVAHEATEATVKAAASYDTLVVYHPLIFRPLDNLDTTHNHTARLAAQLLSRGVGLIAAHTALDNAPPPNALGDHLARSLRLEE